MKKLFLITFLIYFSSDVTSQNNTNQGINLEYNNNIHISNNEMNGYDIYYTVKSDDSNNSWDTYKFQIINAGFDKLSLSKLRIDNKRIKSQKILNYNYLKNIDPCSLHELFSSNKNIFLFLNNKDSISIWKIHYTGTSKNHFYWKVKWISIYDELNIEGY